jgi:hypothetical protein
VTVLGVEYGCKYVLTGPDGTRAVFNDSTDPDFVGILGPETSGLDSADVREDATEAVEEDGGHHGDFYDGRRPVVLVGTIIASSATNRNEKSRRIKLASRALRKDATLKWQPAGGPEVELLLRRQQPVRITKGYVKDFQIPMVAADPSPKGLTTHVSEVDTELSAELTGEPSGGIVVYGEYLYWTRSGASGKICRAKIDGTGVNEEFISAGHTSVSDVTTDGTYLYWVLSATNKVGRAKLDGTEVNAEFIKETGTEPKSLTTDGTYLYWTLGTPAKIGRAKLNGTEVNKEFIAAGSEPNFITNDGTYLYWTRTNANKIGRAKLDGTGANSEFISPGSEPIGITVVDSKYLYWTRGSAAKIARSNLDGTEINTEYLPSGSSPRDITADSSYIYWIRGSSAKRIGRATKNADVVNEGDVPAFPTIRVYGPGKEYKIENTTTGQSILLNNVELKTASKYFDIDFKNHTITQDGSTYAYNALQFASSTWWQIEPGKNSLKITGGPYEVKWRDTYA